MTGSRSWRSSAAWSFACISLAYALSGCATVVHQFRSGEIAFTSDPDGAEVELDNGMACTTPCKLVLDDIVKQNAVATYDGETKTETMLRRPAVPFWLNLIIGLPGGIGMGIDWLTGDMWVYKRDTVFFNFAEEDAEDEGEDGAPPKAEPKAKAEVPAAPPAPPPAASVEAALGVGRAGAAAPDPEAPLPETAALVTVKQAVAEPYLETQVRNYYGGLSADRKERTLRRLYRILLEMQAAGERLDVDEAVRRDRFQELGRRQPAP